jgi:hypothetical protein
MHHCTAEIQTALIKPLLAVGAQIDVTGAAVIGRRRGMSPRDVAVRIRTKPYPALRWSRTVLELLCVASHES